MRGQDFRLTTVVGTLLVTGAFLLAPVATASTTAVSSAGDFRTAANAICQDGVQARTTTLLRHFPDGGKKTPTAKQLTSFVKDYRKVVQKQIDALANLKPPSDLAPKMNKMLSTARKALSKVVAKPTLLIGGTDPFASVDQQALALGLTDCAS